MTIQVSGDKELQRRLTDASGRIDKESMAVLRRAAVRVRRRQKELAPEKSGDLKRSIGYRIRGTRWSRTARIGPVMNEEYPLFQEIGTSRMAANPYVYPALEGEHERLGDELNEMMQRSLR